MPKYRFCTLLGIICLVFLNVNSRTADGAEWACYASTNVGMFFYDRENVRASSNNIVEVWQKLFADNEEQRLSYIETLKKDRLYTKYFDAWKYYIALQNINCRSKSYKHLSTTWYDNKGGVISSADHRNMIGEWNNIVPDSHTEELYRLVCKQKSLLKNRRDWQYFYKWALGNLYYYDAANVVISSKTIVKIWQKEVYSDEFKQKRVESSVMPASTDFAKRQEYEISLYEVDCSKKKMKTVQSCTFDKEGIGYSCLDMDIYQAHQFQFMDPLLTDVGINLMKIACSQKQGSQETQKEKK